MVNLSQYQLVIFDWDGTLSHSVQLIIDHVQLVAKELELPVPDSTHIQSKIGLSMEEAIVCLFPDRDIQPIATAFRHHYYSNVTAAPLFPNVKQVLKELDEAGYLLAVATGKANAGLEKELVYHDLKSRFVTTRCADQSMSKPNPQMLYDILNFTGLEVKDAVMIGDATFDLEMAQHAGMDAIGITTGIDTRETLEGFNHIAVIDELSMLLP